MRKQITNAQLMCWPTQAAEDAREWALAGNPDMAPERLDAYAAGIKRGYLDAYAAFIRHGFMRKCSYA